MKTVLAGSKVAGYREASEAEPFREQPQAHCVYNPLPCPDAMRDMKPRDPSLDIAKGIAIIAIVFGHVWRGLGAVGVISEDNAVFRGVDNTVYMFHLTVFAFAAGLFISRGMVRDGVWLYTVKRELGFLWIYVLWTLITGSSKIALSDFVSTPVSWIDVIQLWQPIDQYWFFGWISIMVVVAALFQPWRSAVTSGAMASVAVVVSLVAWGLTGSVIGTQGMGLTAFFVAGVLIGGAKAHSMMRRRPLTLVAVVTAGTFVLVVLSWPGFATAPTTGGSDRTLLSVIFGVIASTSALVAVLALSPLLSRVKGLGNALVFCGLRSMDIFVAHVIFLAGIRAALLWLGIHSLTAHVVVGTAGAVLASLLLGSIARRMRCGWLFEQPAWLTVRSNGATRSRS